VKEANISVKHNRLENQLVPGGRQVGGRLEADHLATYKHDRKVELGSTEKKTPVRAGLEHVTSGFKLLGVLKQ